MKDGGFAYGVPGADIECEMLRWKKRDVKSISREDAIQAREISRGETGDLLDETFSELLVSVCQRKAHLGSFRFLNFLCLFAAYHTYGF